MYDDKIWVFDDIVDFQYQKHIANTLLSNKFNWFFLNDITDNKGNKNSPPLVNSSYPKVSLNSKLILCHGS